MKEGETIEGMFAQLSKIIGELKASGKIYPPIEHIRRVLRSLPTQWHAKVVALESMNLNTLTYDEVRGDLIAFEKTDLNKKCREESKKKIVAFKANQEDKGEEELAEDEIALITRSVMDSFRKSRNNRRERNFGKEKYITDQSRNDGKCYECGKYGHMASEYPEAKKTYSIGNKNNKALSS
ncbi:hypothetical protein KY290_001453 [Solanum tuberosum]|uniref:CCHC-type domain-containing protein n=1 Tax=Solanum tuberosum TaxID=4113 RepID=A0ABQ7WMD3_SOLTU|nr:hypothetical protein KY290_001453 [Solanum tuberosum]